MIATPTIASVAAQIAALALKVDQLTALVEKLQQPSTPTMAGSLSFNVPANSGLLGAI
jgi:hypothetical protein